ncbi:MAG: glycosyltransferase family 9 protein [Firmicutes bacterium]|nr:glycosyltransferase family 9 protein [Bacillota bacterium]
MAVNKSNSFCPDGIELGAFETDYLNTQKIVVLCLSPLGDALFATPAVRVLRENFPKARIVMIATPAPARIFKSNPFLNQVITVNNHIELISLLADIRKYHYDLAVGFSPLGSFLVRFCGASLRADLSMIPVDAGLSAVEACLAVLETIGIHAQSLTTEFWMSSQEKIRFEASVHRFLEKTGRPFNLGLIAVHCGGHYFTRKRWPVANFIKLIQRLHSEGGHQVVLIGGAEDAIDAQVIQAEVPEVVNAVGKLKLIETAVLLSKCRLMIGNDSGPLHLGAAVGIPTLGLFGPTSPRQFYPYLPPKHSYCYHKLSCSPCYRYRGALWQYLPRCVQAYCMEAITPAEVYALAHQHLSNQTMPTFRWEAPPSQEELPSMAAPAPKEKHAPEAPPLEGLMR